MGASGQATVSAGVIGIGVDEIIQTIPATGISAVNSEVEAWIQPKDTAHHTVDEHIVEPLKVVAYNIVDNVSFDVRLFCENGRIYGDWNVAWAHNES